jgi:hypothetical protein
MQPLLAEARFFRQFDACPPVQFRRLSRFIASPYSTGNVRNVTSVDLHFTADTGAALVACHRISQKHETCKIVSEQLDIRAAQH